jgi:type IV secretory pathway TrbD component
MNRPLTVLGAERRLFFVALIAGGSVFSLMHSLVDGIVLFVVGVIIARIATKHDIEILRVLFNSSKFRRRYDPMKRDLVEITVGRRNGQNSEASPVQGPHVGRSSRDGFQNYRRAHRHGGARPEGR